MKFLFFQLRAWNIELEIRIDKGKKFDNRN